MSASNKVYEIVTERIIAGLEQGSIPWRRPWTAEGTMPRSFNSKKVYRGVNVLLLWFHMTEYGFTSPYYLTFNQVRKLKGKVKKGSKSQLIVFWNWIEKTIPDPETGETKKRSIPILKYYRVFNIEQTEGIEYEKPTENIPEFQRIENCEAIIDSYTDKPTIDHGGHRACYAPVKDHIQMPVKQSFNSEAEYYTTLFHEMVHSTGHEKRLDRAELTDPTAVFGSDVYSKEELTAEIGAAFLAETAGVSSEKLETNQQAYINGWISKLKSDPKLIIQASARAQKAADYIQGVKAETEKPQEAEAVAA